MAAMDQCGARRIAEYRGERVAAMANDLRGIGGIIFGEAACNRLAVGAADRDQITPLELPPDPHCTCPQQALAAEQRFGRAGIDVDFALCGEATRQPGLARSRRLLGDEHSAMPAVAISGEGIARVSGNDRKMGTR